MKFTVTIIYLDQIRKMDDSSSKNRMIAVEGSHLTLPLRMGSKSHSILIPKTTDGRVLFMIPW